jgi:glycerol-1-phosphate dehydrogenase [NAD(P)+]
MAGEKIKSERFLKLPVADMIDCSFDCNCGKTHKLAIKKIISGNNITESFMDFLADYKNKKIFMICDKNTNEVYGKEIYKILLKSNYKIKQFIFDGIPQLIPNERAIVKALIEIENDTSLIIAVGSGTINDISRFISSKLNIPYIIFATAPSMDGYASSVSSLIINNFKSTYNAVYPLAIIADYSILKNAPLNMIKAGFGDMIGKLTALTDWELSKKLNKEYYCETIASLTRNALEKCFSIAEYIEDRDEMAIKSIFDGLILSGIAIGLIGNSRPASGSEHHISHYWELDAVKNGREHPLHGNMVGVATVIVSEIYTLLNEYIALPVDLPDTKKIINFLNKAGCIYKPLDLNIDKELLKKSILYAFELRPERFTILSHANNLGLLSKISEKILEKYI